MLSSCSSAQRPDVIYCLHRMSLISRESSSAISSSFYFCCSAVTDHRLAMQITVSRAERQFCVHDLSGPTAGERSVSAPGHQSGFVNFLHTASQLLSPQTLTGVWSDREAQDLLFFCPTYLHYLAQKYLLNLIQNVSFFSFFTIDCLHIKINQFWALNSLLFVSLLRNLWWI